MFICQHVDVPSTRLNQRGVLGDLGNAVEVNRPEPAARLVSVVPAGTHISGGVYLLTWEVED